MYDEFGYAEPTMRMREIRDGSIQRLFKQKRGSVRTEYGDDLDRLEDEELMDLDGKGRG